MRAFAVSARDTPAQGITGTPPRPRRVELALVFILYYAGAKLGVIFTVMPEGLAIVWLPNAVLLAALLRFGKPAFPAVAVLGLLAELAADWPTFSVLEAQLFGLANLAEASLAFLLLSRWRFDTRFASVENLWKFALAGPIAGALLAALLGAATYHAFRGGQTTYLEFVRIWWFGDALGLLILTPLLLGFRPFRSGVPLRTPALRPLDAVVGATAAAAIALLFVSPDGRIPGLRLGPELLLPFVLYAAARFPQRWSTAAVAVAAVVVIALTTSGRSPFGAVSPREAVISAQELLAVMSLMAIGLSALLAQLQARYEEIEARVRERTIELRRANERLTALSIIDPLTELYNRRGLFEAAQRDVAQAHRSGRDLALLMIDLDRFKAVNDRYGHLAGDEALRRCAAVLRRHARIGDICGRYGGEELVVLAPDTDLPGAIILAERIREALNAEVIESPKGPFSVTASIGVTELDRGEPDLAGLLRRADAALYRAKAAGRNRVECIGAPSKDAKNAP